MSETAEATSPSDEKPETDEATSPSDEKPKTDERRRRGNPGLGVIALILGFGLALVFLSGGAEPKNVALFLAFVLFAIFITNSKDPAAGGALALAIILIVFALSSARIATQSTPPASGSAPETTAVPGAEPPAPLTAATETPIPPPGTPTYDCQPGIQVGKTINVAYPAVRMRLSPGYVEKDDEVDTKHYMGTGDKVAIKGGPQIKDGLCWWLVEQEGYEGWTADHSREGRLLLSADPLEK